MIVSLVNQHKAVPSISQSSLSGRKFTARSFFTANEFLHNSLSRKKIYCVIREGSFKLSRVFFFLFQVESQKVERLFRKFWDKHSFGSCAHDLALHVKKMETNIVEGSLNLQNNCFSYY